VIAYNPAATPARSTPVREELDGIGADALSAQASWRSMIGNLTQVPISSLESATVTPIADVQAVNVADATLSATTWDVTCATGSAETNSTGITFSTPTLFTPSAFVSSFGALYTLTAGTVDVLVTNQDTSTFTVSGSSPAGGLAFLGVLEFAARYVSFLVTPVGGAITLRDPQSGIAF
jgi:hypothetical protein